MSDLNTNMVNCRLFVMCIHSSLFTAYRGRYVFGYVSIVHTSESDRPITKVYKRRRAAISPIILMKVS